MTHGGSAAPAVPTTEATRWAEDGQATPAATTVPAALLLVHEDSTLERVPDSRTVAVEDGVASEPL